MDERQNSYFIEKEEKWQSRLDRLRFATGMTQFFGIVIGGLLILVLILLLLSLVTWLRQDIESTIAFMDARL